MLWKQAARCPQMHRQAARGPCPGSPPRLVPPSHPTRPPSDGHMRREYRHLCLDTATKRTRGGGRGSAGRGQATRNGRNMKATHIPEKRFDMVEPVIVATRTLQRGVLAARRTRWALGAKPHKRGNGTMQVDSRRAQGRWRQDGRFGDHTLGARPVFRRCCARRRRNAGGGRAAGGRRVRGGRRGSSMPEIMFGEVHAQAGWRKGFLGSPGVRQAPLAGCGSRQPGTALVQGQQIRRGARRRRTGEA